MAEQRLTLRELADIGRDICDLPDSEVSDEKIIEMLQEVWERLQAEKFTIEDLGHVIIDMWVMVYKMDGDAGKAIISMLLDLHMTYELPDDIILVKRMSRNDPRTS